MMLRYSRAFVLESARNWGRFSRYFFHRLPVVSGRFERARRVEQ
jgi:hypothetical protein